MAQKWILVSSHRRSGTHFLIDSLIQNIPDARFPSHYALPKDFNVGSLFRKKERIYEIFKDKLKVPHPVIIKNHLLPEELDLADPKDKHEALARDIFGSSYKFYIYRDGKDVLVSLYHFLQPESDFKTFLRSLNDPWAPSRRSSKIDESRASEIDQNRVRYWAYHKSVWMQRNDIIPISFQDLKNNFSEVMANALSSIREEVGFSLRKPMIPKSKQLYHVVTRLYKLGLIKKIPSTSVSPRKGIIGGGKAYFDAGALAFFEREVEQGRSLVSTGRAQ